NTQRKRSAKMLSENTQRKRSAKMLSENAQRKHSAKTLNKNAQHNPMLNKTKCSTQPNATKCSTKQNGSLIWFHDLVLWYGSLIWFHDLVPTFLRRILPAQQTPMQLFCFTNHACIHQWYAHRCQNGQINFGFALFLLFYRSRTIFPQRHQIVHLFCPSSSNGQTEADIASPTNTHAVVCFTNFFSVPQPATDANPNPNPNPNPTDRMLGLGQNCPTFLSISQQRTDHPSFLSMDPES
ncbi:MAG: hypothetical protein ACX933_18060, partial [Marinobacter adhaerens]